MNYLWILVEKTRMKKIKERNEKKFFLSLWKRTLHCNNFCLSSSIFFFFLLFPLFFCSSFSPLIDHKELFTVTISFFFPVWILTSFSLGQDARYGIDLVQRLCKYGWARVKVSKEQWEMIELSYLELRKFMLEDNKRALKVFFFLSFLLFHFFSFLFYFYLLFFFIVYFIFSLFFLFLSFIFFLCFFFRKRLKEEGKWLSCLIRS